MEKKHSHTCIPNNSLAMHKDSKTISKSSTNNKPKIRIIHIFAPQIIKTDVENFRELVQRKTGKPAAAIAGSGEDQDYSIRRINSNNNNSLMSGLLDDDDNKKPKSKNKKMEQLMRNKFTVKEEQICISDEISSGGYLGGFSDLEEGFISEFGGFSSSMLPLD